MARVTTLALWGGPMAARPGYEDKADQSGARDAPVIAVVTHKPTLFEFRVQPDLGPVTVKPGLGQIVVGD